MKFGCDDCDVVKELRHEDDYDGVKELRREVEELRLKYAKLEGILSLVIFIAPLLLAVFLKHY